MNLAKVRQSASPKNRDAGLLFLRIGIGIAFILHGYPKITGGPEYWRQIGGAMGKMGVHFIPEFWGFMAAFAEFGSGILLILGLFFNFANGLLLITMLVATAQHIDNGDTFNGYSHALEAAILFASLLIIGAGRYSLDERRKVNRR